MNNLPTLSPKPLLRIWYRYIQVQYVYIIYNMSHNFLQKHERNIINLFTFLPRFPTKVVEKNQIKYINIFLLYIIITLISRNIKYFAG